MSQARVENLGDGLWLVNFATPEDVTAARSAGLVTALSLVSREGPIALLARAPPELRGVEPSMVSLWLDAFATGKVRVHSIGVVTRSLAVRVAVRGLEGGLRIRGSEVSAETFGTLEDAVTWARARAEARAARLGTG